METIQTIPDKLREKFNRQTQSFLDYDEMSSEQISYLFDQLLIAWRDKIIPRDYDKRNGIIPFIICPPNKIGKSKSILARLNLGKGPGTATFFLKGMNVVDKIQIPEDRPWIVFNINLNLHEEIPGETFYVNKHKDNEIMGVRNSLTFHESVCLLEQLPLLIMSERCGIHVGGSYYQEDDKKYHLHIYRLGTGKHSFAKVARENEFFYDFRYSYPRGETYFFK